MITVAQAFKKRDDKKAATLKLDYRSLVQRFAYRSDEMSNLHLDLLYDIADKTGRTAASVQADVDAVAEYRTLLPKASDLPRLQAKHSLMQADVKAHPADVAAAQAAVDAAQLAADRVNELRASHGHLV